MKTSYQYEMTIFVSKKLGFGFILETDKTSTGEYQVKITRFDPAGEAKDRVTLLKSTIGGLSFNECCDKIIAFETQYNC